MCFLDAQLRRVSASRCHGDCVPRANLFNRTRPVRRFQQCARRQALVLVPHAKNVAILACQQFHNEVLRHVGVLKFIHMQVRVTPLIFLQHTGMVAQELHGVNQQIVKIHRVVVQQFFLIAFVNASDRFMPIRRGHVLLGTDEFVFGFGNRGEYLTGTIHLVVDVLLTHNFLNQFRLVVVVKNDKARRESHRFPIAPQKARANRVKRADGQIAHFVFADELRQTVAHFARGFVCKRHRQNVVRRKTNFFQQIRDAIGQHACFTRARTGKHQHRTVHHFNRLTLLRIQLRKQRHVLNL